MFMCGLATQRRKRGLRAATVNVGAIIGAGYMQCESRRSPDAIVQKLHMMRLSEEDWHQAVGEAIDASRLDSAHGPELTTGLQTCLSTWSILPPGLPIPGIPSSSRIPSQAAATRMMPQRQPLYRQQGKISTSSSGVGKVAHSGLFRGNIKHRCLRGPAS